MYNKIQVAKWKTIKKGDVMNVFRMHTFLITKSNFVVTKKQQKQEPEEPMGVHEVN